MTIEYIKGDLFKTPIKVILHGCNAKGVMGGGVAAIVKKVYPAAFEEYFHYCDDGFADLGTNCVVQDSGKVIVNAITQDGYGTHKRQVSYDAIVSVFEKLEDDLKFCDEFEGVVAMPKIGAGLGGGDWDIIATIIEKTVNGKYKVVVYEYD